MSISLELLRYYYSLERDQFTLEEDCYEGWVLLAVQQGTFEFHVEDVSGDWETAGFGDVILCPPGKRLRRKALERITFHFAEWRLPEGSTLPTGKLHIHDLARLSSTFAYLREWHEQRTDKDVADAQHLVSDLVYIARRERQNSEHRVASKSDLLMREAATHIERHAGLGEISLQILAEQLGLSGPQLTRRFQAAYGISPVRYATALRLTKARRLLVETEDTLEAVAELCGYQNAFYFSRVFTQHMKMSPSVYRKKYQI